MNFDIVDIFKRFLKEVVNMRFLDFIVYFDLNISILCKKIICEGNNIVLYKILEN